MDHPTGSAAPQRTLAHYLHLFRRSWVLILVPTLLAMIVAFLLASRSDEIFVASATVRVADPTATSGGGGLSTAEIDRQLDTSVEILGSAPVRHEVLDAVPAEVADAFESVDANRVGETVLVEVEVRATDPAAAQALAQQWAETYVAQEQADSVAGLSSRATALREQADALQPQIDDLDAQIALVTPVAGSPTPPTLTSLLAERQAVLDAQTQLRSSAIDFEIEAALREGAVALVVPAEEPSAPVEPKPLRSTALAGVLGLLVGLGLAVLRDELDTRVRGRDDLRQIAPNLPVLAAIPFHRHGGSPHAALRLGADDALMEAFRSLGTNLEFIEGATRDPDAGRGRVLVVTSPNAGDGKSSTTANLGMALASIGRRVVLVSADLRDPDLHHAFRASDQPGLVDVVVDGLDPTSVVQTIDTGRRVDLQLVASGRPTNDPVGILSSDALGALIEVLAVGVDYVLIDTPPVLPVTDTLVLARVADAALLLVADRRTQRRAVEATIEALDQVGYAVLGTVLTRAEGVEPVYGYGSESPEGRAEVAAAPAGAADEVGDAGDVAPQPAASGDAARPRADRR